VSALLPTAVTTVPLGNTFLTTLCHVSETNKEPHASSARPEGALKEDAFPGIQSKTPEESVDPLPNSVVIIPDPPPAEKSTFRTLFPKNSLM